MLIFGLLACLFSGILSAFPALAYSTYLRDAFTPQAVAVDAAGDIYLAGNAVVDPVTQQTTALVVKLNPKGTQYLYVRYIGGSVKDSASAIAVDSAGNAYVVGSTASPDFPVTSGGNLGIEPSSTSDSRSFAVKLDPNGVVLFSDLLGGPAASSAQAVAVNPAGQIIVSGTVSDSSKLPFPSTAGAYGIANTANHPYLLELDSTGTKVVFSATGIGGTSLALDASGNIYVAGSTYLLDYPTTPGAYQTTFPKTSVCIAPCQATFQGHNQYVTKVDPAGSKLIYSTAVSGTTNTDNSGLAVDSAGNVYLTGYAAYTYPYTTPPPPPPPPSVYFYEVPYVSKLDAAGQKLLFSVPIGGAGVQVDTHGSVFVAGGVGVRATSLFYSVANNLPVLANVPSQCLPNGNGVGKVAYAAQLDGTSGEVLGSQFIAGSTLNIFSTALSGSTLWMAGPVSLTDFPLTPGALVSVSTGPTVPAGAYLGAVDFSQPQPAAGTPQVYCIVDSASMMPVGSAAVLQLLTAFGTNLGPAAGASATDYTTTTLGGTQVSVGTAPAPLLYASSTQLNFAMPVLPFDQTLGTMQVAANGQTSAARQIPIAFENPSLFLNRDQTQLAALNADGSANSPGNPAKLGSTISVFANGLTRNPQVVTDRPQLSGALGWSVKATSPVNPFVLRVDVVAPPTLVDDFGCGASAPTVCFATISLFDAGFVSNGDVPTPSQAFGGVVYVDRGP